ncbi:hypothetical protein PV387_11310 [Streptomyces sp. ME02-6987-2C]|uniref:hypothetical protein n=1 Tax=unclassified Streptomyces TaxID=2593676 RepID=UPI0029A293E7|nr:MULTISPECIES: hypothetical protein [unclassified Streptomyces]MDX3366609.1 hypothetical protein [Streptomyces sp. ME02-6987-2C]MDX3421832.1 hypothetical protein [Streptomyces sp. ME02-6985-2c]
MPEQGVQHGCRDGAVAVDVRLVVEEAHGFRSPHGRRGPAEQPVRGTEPGPSRMRFGSQACPSTSSAGVRSIGGRR